MPRAALLPFVFPNPPPGCRRPPGCSLFPPLLECCFDRAMSPFSLNCPPPKCPLPYSLTLYGRGAPPLAPGSRLSPAKAEVRPGKMTKRRSAPGANREMHRQCTNNSASTETEEFTQEELQEFAQAFKVGRPPPTLFSLSLSPLKAVPSPVISLVCILSPPFIFPLTQSNYSLAHIHLRAKKIRKSQCRIPRGGQSTRLRQPNKYKIGTWEDLISLIMALGMRPAKRQRAQKLDIWLGQNNNFLESRIEYPGNGLIYSKRLFVLTVEFAQIFSPFSTFAV